MPRKSLILNRGQAFRGREEVCLLVHAYHFSLCFFFPTFFLFFSLFLFCFVTLLFPLFSFQLLLVCYSGDCCYCCCCESLVMIVVMLMIPLCMVEAPYILPVVTSFLLFHPLTTTFVWVWMSFQITHQFVSCLATTTYLCKSCRFPLPDKKKLFCLLVHRGIPIRNNVGILSYYPTWYASNDSNSSFPLLGGMSSQQDISPKEFKWEPQNRLPPSPYRQTIPSLTSDSLPTTPVLAGYRLVVLEPCACSTSIYFQSLFAAYAFAMV